MNVTVPRALLRHRDRARSTQRSTGCIEERRRYFAQRGMAATLEDQTPRAGLAARLAAAADRRDRGRPGRGPGRHRRDAPSCSSDPDDRPADGRRAGRTIERHGRAQAARSSTRRRGSRSCASATARTSPEVVNAQATLETLRDMLQREVESADAGRDVAHLAAAVAPVVAPARARPASRRCSTPCRQDRGPDRRDTTTICRCCRTATASWSRRSDQARVNEHMVRDVNVILLTPASPGTPTNTRDYVRLGLAPAFSLVVGVGLAFFIDGLDLTVRTADQAEEDVELPVLASITERRRRRVADPTRRATRMTRIFDALRKAQAGPSRPRARTSAPPSPPAPVTPGAPRRRAELVCRARGRAASRLPLTRRSPPMRRRRCAR